jgi:uncharacterized cupredoxin-like copper-binding protein
VRPAELRAYIDGNRVAWRREMVSKRIWGAVAVLAAGTLALAGCATGGASPSPAGGDAGATTIAVTLQEWAVVPAANSAPAGEVTFEVTNDGPEDIHEFVVIKTDLDVAELPTDADGAVVEGGDGMEVIDEIEDLAVGDTQTLTVDVDAGSYALICNIWDDEEGEAHYEMGMRTAFTVTD